MSPNVAAQAPANCVYVENIYSAYNVYFMRLCALQYIV